MSDSESDASPQQDPSPRLDDDSLAPPLPARIIIKTKLGGANSSGKLVFKNASSGAPIEAISFGGGQCLPSTSRGFPDFTSGSAPLHAATKRSGFLMTESGNSRSFRDTSKRFRGNQLLSDDWRYDQSLSRLPVTELDLGSLLIQRELPGVFGRTHQGTPSCAMDNRLIYTHVTPNHSVLDIHHPPLFMRKFSPDGRHFVGFSSDLQAVYIYRYQGCGVVGQFFQESETENEDDPHILQRDLFKTLFREMFRVRAVFDNPSHTICRDFSLYTVDSNYVLIATTATSDIADEEGPEVRKTNESLPVHHRSPLEDYRFMLLDLTTGAITDQLDFKVDKIQISHSIGVYLYGDTLTILSTQHQRIHFFTVTKGKFAPIRILGQYCFHEMGPGPSWWSEFYPNVAPADEMFISTLKQKLFLEFYRVAQKDSKQENSYGPIMEFHRLHMFYKRLKMWKFQMLDENKLLIKWAPEDVVISRATEAANYPQFFTFFDIAECRFYAVFDHREQDMLRIFEKFRDDFRNPLAQHPNFQSDTFYSRAVYERLKRLTVNAKNGGGIQEACSRLLAQLPFPCQSFTSSPYVDMSLFQYDTSLISNTERVKTKSDEPVRFYARDSGLLKFTLHVTKNPGGRRTKRFVTHIFHPTDPLILTCEKPGVQIIDTDVHVHLRRPV